MEKFLPFALPDIGQEEIDEVVDTLKSGWITSGPKVKRLENDFAEYIGAKYAISLNSATAGLHLALDAINLQAGEKVIVPTYTFTATAEVVRYFNADPIFCDVEENSFNIDPGQIEKILESHDTKKIRAIMPVHIAGQACNMSKILALAKKYDLKVIEDAAHTLPATHQKRLIGTIGDLTVFSFYATKTITTGEGGMVTTDNADFKKRIETMRLHGFNRNIWDRYNSAKAAWYYEIIAPGFKYNMTDIAAAIGIHQLKKANQFYERRNYIAGKYFDAFNDIPQLKTPSKIIASDKHSYHLYIIQIPAQIRDKFIEQMSKGGVNCSVHFIPLHLQPYWAEKYTLQKEDFPVAQKCYEQAVSLPIFSKMSESDIEKVISTVKNTLSEIS